MVLTKVLVPRGIVMSVRRQVRPISCYGPVSVDGHVPQNSDAVILGESLGFMFIPSFLHLNAKLFADLPVHVCTALLWQWMYSVLASSGQPETRWSMVSSKRPYSLHFGSTLDLLRMLCLYQRAGRL